MREYWKSANAIGDRVLVRNNSERGIALERKYQVFVSSTYEDLKEERRSIINVLLMADCIPSGMEMFSAADEEQFNVIKQVIDMCDFYILILGDRYGSVNSHTGKSYTEMEYEYALNKGVPILVFAKACDLDKAGTSEPVENRAKQKIFRDKALHNRLGGIWKNIAELNAQVAISLMKAKESYNRPGWIRSLGFDPENVEQTINELRDKVGRLENENKELMRGQESKVNYDLKKSSVTLSFTESLWIFDKEEPDSFTISIPFETIFKHISVRLSGKVNEKDFINAVSSYKEGYVVDYQQGLVLKNQLIYMGLLEEKGDDGLIQLTESGRKLMFELNAPKIGN